MAKTKISEFSSTAGNNTDIDSINIAEGCAPSGINNAIRELMAQLKDFQTGAAGDSFNGPVGTTTAAAGAFTTLSASGTTTLSGLTASTALALDASKNVVSVTNTGTGNNVLATSPTLVTPILGTPTSVTLTNATGLPISTGVSGLGTGIATALAVNVGSAGAPVINGGALGTPSSGTVTNLTGTASININGTVGATTPTTGAFTTLTTSSTVTLNGGTANGVAYLNGSKVLTTGSALTFDGNTLTGTSASTAQAIFKGWSATGANTSSGAIRLGGNVSYQGKIDYAADGNTTFTYENTYASGVHNWKIAGSEQMRLTSTGLELKGKLAAGYTDFSGIPTNGAAFAGSVGIGTSSPAYKLDVVGNAGIARIQSTGAGQNAQLNLQSTAATWSVGQNITLTSTGTLEFYNGSTRLQLTSSGNLGLGVTPSAWGSGWVATQVAGGGASLAGRSTNPEVYLTANAHYNGTNWIYKTSTVATQYSQDTGIHKWWVAPSGTAGDAISFSQAMTLTAAGELLVGKTTTDEAVQGLRLVGASGLLVVTRDGGDPLSLRRTANDGAIASFRRDATLVGTISVTTSATAYNTSSDYRLKNITGPITTSGAYIDSLNPVEGTWKADGSTFVGLIAHEVQEASRTNVATGVKDGEEMQGMDYSSAEIIANLIAEVKSLRQRLAAAGI